MTLPLWLFALLAGFAGWAALVLLLALGMRCIFRRPDLPDGTCSWLHSRHLPRGNIYDDIIIVSFRSLRLFRSGKSDRLLEHLDIHPP